MKIAILGSGAVGKALAEGFVRSKHQVQFGSRDPSRAEGPPGTSVVTQKEATAWGEVAVLAVPYVAVRETVEAIGADSLDGKILVDPTNALTPDFELAVGFTTSGAEELAKQVPGARVVKAFNTVFAQNQTTGHVGEQSLTLFVAGDDNEAKETVMNLGRGMGFEPVDSGPLKSARYLEPMALMLITLGYGLEMGPEIGFRLVRSES
ncbi:MAG: NADPH-dependent F420 reductase [Thermoplasmata archaeon]